MLAILLLSFLVTGGIAFYDHFEQNERYNQLRFERKEKSVRASMEYFLNQQGGFISPDSAAKEFNDKICELSDVHNLFIALYDLRGNYLISTNSQTLDSLHLPYHLNYSILKQLSSGTDRAVIDREFSSEDLALAYWYFKDIEGKPIAITNVVYDTTDAENKNIWMFLSELFQSYIVLFLLAALAAYALSSYITRSLQAIVISLQGIQIGKRNDPIKWKGQDEIGALVREYNRMLHELERSAAQIAQQERESAWREMAKQVAHEIKNPLTPMRLRVQHLQRSWKDDPDQFEEKLSRFCAAMTEQIDTLARIANEFSHFAKMPKQNPEFLHLDVLTEDVVSLFRDNQNVDFTFRKYALEEPRIFADKNQLVRVLNNLINNAIQAIPGDRIGRVDVALRQCKDHLVIRVNDNGIGINSSSKNSIFVPNFTTKSNGTGLGLSMVKSMVEQSGGHVWFRSQAGRGASFYISLPISKA